MTRLLHATLLATVLAFAASSCGGRDCGRSCTRSQCSRLCEQLLPKLVNIFGASAEELDCPGPKWDIDCAQCYRYFNETYLIQVEPGTCEAL